MPRGTAKKLNNKKIKSTRLSSYRSVGQKSLQANIELSVELCSFQGCQGRLHFLDFSSFWSPPASLGSWPLHLQSQHYSIFKSLSLSLLPLLSLPYKDTCDYIESTQIIQDNLPISRGFSHNHKVFFFHQSQPQSLFFSFSHNHKVFFLPCKVEYSWIWGIMMWTSLRDQMRNCSALDYFISDGGAKWSSLGCV